MKAVLNRFAPMLFALAAAAAAAYYAGAWRSDPRMRRVIDIAGDDGMPGWRFTPDWRATRNFIERLDAPLREAYLGYLSNDNFMVAAMLVLLLAIGWASWRCIGRAWSWILIAAAAGYAASDWTENALLAGLLSKASPTDAVYISAATATTCKWLFGDISALLA